MAEIWQSIAVPLRLIHALVGILLVVGLGGRLVALTQAEHTARAADLSGMAALLRAAGVFERIVVPTSVVVLVLGLLTA